MAMLSLGKPHCMASRLPIWSGTRTASVQLSCWVAIISATALTSSRGSRLGESSQRWLAFSCPSVSTNVKKLWSPYSWAVWASSRCDFSAAASRAVMPPGRYSCFSDGMRSTSLS